MPARRTWILLALAALSALAPLAAQQPARRWELRGFDFSPNGVWRRPARRVREARAAALARGDMASLNAPLRAGLALMAAPGTAQRSQMAVTGVLYAPVFLVAPRNIPTASLSPAATYTAVLFGSTPPLGRPYTVRTFYEEMSNGLLSVQGQAHGWTALDSNDTFYEGNCNGLCSGGTTGGHVADLMREAVQKSDATVDYGQYDNDGPDGVPNSGDDDGRVDLVILVHPEVGGECGSTVTNIWSHRWYYGGWTGTTIVTADPRRDGSGNPIPGQFLVADDYIIQPGVGGATACDGSQIMPPGTIAHEMGHGLNLPDLYDVYDSDGDDSEGIGEWGLMSSGNYARPLSPAHMEGWSRLQLGWVTMRDLTGSGTYTLGAYTVADTIFRVTPTGANPRSEYFLIENRQPQLSDTALIGKGKGPGLLVYHVDGQQIQDGFGSNSINSGAIHGLWILQADGLNQLRSSTVGVRNRGDGGDPFPGTSGRTVLSAQTNPNLLLNATTVSRSPGFAIDSIRQVVAGGEMSLRLRFGATTLVRAADSTAQIRFRGATTQVVRDIFAVSDTATVEMDTFQLRSDGRAEFRFVSWSDGGARAHQVTFPVAGDTLIAAMSRRFRLDFGVGLGTGSVSASGGVTTGSFLAETDSVVLTPQPQGGQTFLGWGGDTVTTAAPLILRMRRAYSVSATFQVLLVPADTALRTAVMAAAYADTLQMSGGTGVHTFALLSGSLPPGLALSSLGAISGTPLHDSTYTFTVRATSGVQRLDLTLTMTVAAPTLAAAAVMNQLLLGGSALTAEEQAYMDLAGNHNGQFDIGDVTAWLDRNPGLLNPSVMRQLMAAGVRR